jgi:uncharacterized protein YjiS (DUF1127 family)
MTARAGSPASVAVSANAAWLAIPASIVDPALTVAVLCRQRFGPGRNIEGRLTRKLRAMTLLSALRWLKLCARRARTRRQLRDLPAHLLRDIGIDDAARARESARWLWQGVVAEEVDEAPNENARGKPSRVSLFPNP